MPKTSDSVAMASETLINSSLSFSLKVNHFTNTDCLFRLEGILPLMSGPECKVYKVLFFNSLH